MPKQKLNRECRAKEGENCHGGISREHVISKSIVEEFGASKVSAGGRAMGLNSFTIKYICRRHNSILSEFDSEALKLIKAIKNFRNKSIQNKFYENPQVVVIDGEKLEKWFAKTYLNIITMREISTNSELDIFRTSQSHLRGLCFNKSDLIHPQGIYILRHGMNPFSIKALNTTMNFRCTEGEAQILSTTGEKKISPNYRLQHFFYMSIWGIEFVFVFNLTGISNEDWSKIIGNIIENTPWLKDAARRPQNPIALGRDNKHSGIIRFKW